MKIGILTFHCTNNYGAVLQAYALKSYINSLGYKCSVIDYKPEYLTKKYIPFSKHRIKQYSRKKLFKYLIELIKAPFLVLKSFIFRRFQNRKLDLVSLNDVPKLNFVILGSDQIWNFGITKGIDNIFLGNFIEGPKYFSYAASMETVISSKELQTFKQKISKLHSISVRERSLNEWLFNKLSIDSKIVIDPVFLLDKSFWKDFSKKTFKKTQPYIFIYYFGDSKPVYDYAKQYALSNNLKIITLGIDILFSKDSKNFVSPERFISLLSNAEIVLTNSFHAISYSIIFSKPFVAFSKKNSKNERVKNILQLAGEEFRLISPDELINTDITLFTKKSNNQNSSLKNNILNSRSYLSNILAN